MTEETSLTIVRRIKAPPQAVFDAFVLPDKVALWWGPDQGPVLSADIDPKIGGGFHVRFRTEDGSEHGSSGTFETFDPPHRLTMSWKWDNDDDPVSRVEVALRPIDGGTELTFTHSRLPDAASRDSHEQGWNGALDKLERAFEDQEPGQ
jgi:uncharacterized protein YndB with AHSA1/START domain